MKKHIKIFIEGKLEDADFNYYCQTGAFKYDINAVYKNGDTRHIYIEAEGEKEKLDLFVNAIENGPLKPFLYKFDTAEGELKNIQGFTSLRDKKEKKTILRKFKNFLS
jgi:acylphosphatase